MTVARRYLALACLAVVLPRNAAAHAVITASQPEHGSTIRPGAIAVILSFNARIDRVRSQLTLTSPTGQASTLRIRDDSTASILRADAAVNEPGRWRLRWQVLATDGHITRGDILFSVAAS